MNKAESRQTLRNAARRIAANRHELPASPLTALRKLFAQEQRDWAKPGAPRIGWKRGELFEVLTARSVAELRAEWGDCGYYLAQSWRWVWRVYAAITPQAIIENSVAKFQRRAGMV